MSNLCGSHSSVSSKHVPAGYLLAKCCPCKMSRVPKWEFITTLPTHLQGLPASPPAHSPCQGTPHTTNGAWRRPRGRTSLEKHLEVLLHRAQPLLDNPAQGHVPALSCSVTCNMAALHGLFFLQAAATGKQRIWGSMEFMLLNMAVHNTDKIQAMENGKQEEMKGNRIKSTFNDSNFWKWFAAYLKTERWAVAIYQLSSEGTWDTQQGQRWCCFAVTHDTLQYLLLFYFFLSSRITFLARSLSLCKELGIPSVVGRIKHCYMYDMKPEETSSEPFAFQ